MTITKIGMSCLTVSDFGKAKRFFVDTLGLTEKSGAAEMQWMELAAGNDHAMLGVGGYNPEYSGPLKPGTNGVVSFLVDSVDAEKATLEQKGVRFVGPVNTIEGHVKLATFVDDDQNTFFLVEDLSKTK
jgi:predicted enzyme related to lactoylglutathione lyase